MDIEAYASKHWGCDQYERCAGTGSRYAPDHYNVMDAIAIPADLNSGAGGDFIWLAYSKDPKYGAPYRSLLVTQNGRRTWARWESGMHYQAVIPEDKIRPVGAENGRIVDLNAGAGGDFIYLYGDKECDLSGQYK